MCVERMDRRRSKRLLNLVVQLDNNPTVVIVGPSVCRGYYVYMYFPSPAKQ